MTRPIPLVAFATAFVLLFSTGCAVFEPIGGFFSRTGDAIRGRTPLSDARRMEDPDFPDERRTGMMRLVKRDFAQKPPYTTRYRQIAEFDTSPVVRAAAVRSLNISRDTGATPLFTKLLSDPSPLVRLEAAKALFNMPDDTASNTLMRLMNSSDEPLDVRIAATRALRRYPRLEIARALVGQLLSRQFALAYEARFSLRFMTGRDYRYEEALWLSYLTGPEKPF